MSEAGDNKTLPERLRENADLSELAIDFMADTEMREETLADIALWREAATVIETTEAERDKARAQVHDALELRHKAGEEQTAAEARVEAVERAAKHARSLAAAPDYDEEAIRDALWAVVAAVLASSVKQEDSRG